MESDMTWTKDHPVSNVQWVDATLVIANNYNPNKVAKPEMDLLMESITSDGFTQPIVVWEHNGVYEVVDGFHRHLIGKKLGMSHLPVTIINQHRTKKGDRMASTIRHNRARGVHQVSSMSEIIQEMVKLGWDDKKIGKELGMEPDEVLRLKQIGGLAELYANTALSEAWDVK